jgi:hypothetical protein
MIEKQIEERLRKNVIEKRKESKRKKDNLLVRLKFEQ